MHTGCGKKPRALKGDTYVDGGLGTTHVRGLDVKLSSDLPLALGLLDLAGASDVDLPAVVVNELALALTGHLVVGPGDLGGAVTVVLLEHAGGLLALRAAAWSAGCTIGPNALHLLLEGKVLQEQKRQLKRRTHTSWGKRDKKIYRTYDCLLGLGGEGERPVGRVVRSVGVVVAVVEAAWGHAGQEYRDEQRVGCLDDTYRRHRSKGRHRMT